MNYNNFSFERQLYKMSQLKPSLKDMDDEEIMELDLFKSIYSIVEDLTKINLMIFNDFTQRFEPLRPDNNFLTETAIRTIKYINNYDVLENLTHITFLRALDIGTDNWKIDKMYSFYDLLEQDYTMTEINRLLLIENDIKLYVEETQ